MPPVTARSVARLSGRPDTGVRPAGRVRPAGHRAPRASLRSMRALAAALLALAACSSEPAREPERRQVVVDVPRDRAPAAATLVARSVLKY